MPWFYVHVGASDVATSESGSGQKAAIGEAVIGDAKMDLSSDGLESGDSEDSDTSSISLPVPSPITSTSSDSSQ